jgi:hypothetical protein
VTAPVEAVGTGVVMEQLPLRPAWAGEPEPLDAGWVHGDRGVRPFIWLGTHELSWLERDDLAHVPWFVSRRRLLRRARFPQAKALWAMDSGAFTEASQYGRWTCTAAEYVEFVRRAAGEVGNLAWVAPMDLCCEPSVVEKVARTGWLDSVVRTVPGMPDAPAFKHLMWTVRNFIELRTLLDRPDDPHVIPVVQGWTLDDYEWCLQLYAMAGIDLTAELLVGIGSTCRRDADMAILAKVAWLGECGINRIHAFGVKSDAVTLVAHRVSSTDSMAWSYGARRRGKRVPGCDATHAHCGNCPVAALAWRERLLTRTDWKVARWRNGMRVAAEYFTAAGLLDPHPVEVDPAA